MDAAAQAAVGAGDDVLSAGEFSERDDAIGYQFRVLDEAGGVADDTRKEDLSGGEFHVVRLCIHVCDGRCRFGHIHLILSYATDEMFHISIPQWSAEYLNGYLKGWA